MGNLHTISGLHYEMMRRCYNPKSIAFKQYGAKGIKVCEEWHDKENFKKVLYYTYNNSLQYGFSEKKLRELLETITVNMNFWDNGFDMLEELSSNNINDDFRQKVKSFLYWKDEEEKELWISILTKDLKCGISSFSQHIISA